MRSIFDVNQNEDVEISGELSIKSRSMSDMNNNLDKVSSCSDGSLSRAITDSSEETIRRNGSTASLSVKLISESQLDKKELHTALSRKNSFISYFDNKYNSPDLTVKTLMDAVDHIIRQKLLG